MEIVEINKYETKFLYDEIFVQEVYGSRGISLGPNDVVMDIGANIGLFALYMAHKFNPAKIFCFEPAPHCFDVLERNLAPLGSRAIVSRAAIGDSEGEAEFTYYPNYTIMSSLFADAERDDQVLRAGARTQAERQFGAGIDERMVDMLVGAKLGDAQSFTCPVTTLSKVINEHRLDRVALVKVDVECAENIVLAGIEDAHWPLIDQLVVEVHDQGGREHEAMRDMLLGKGFQVQLISESTLENSGIYEIVARR